MAYHQARQREPLFDASMQETLEKRGTEFLGLVIAVLGGLLAAVIFSYSPSDPSWISASDAPVKNVLGVTGATIAAPLLLILGWGSMALAVIAMGWGARLMAHAGVDRAFGRVIFSPIAVASVSIYCATLEKGAEWTHSFGLGGLFGDMVVGSLITFLPFALKANLVLVALVFSIVMCALMLFALGFSRAELRKIGYFLVVGTVMTYALIRNLLGRGAQATVDTAKHYAHERANERRAMQAYGRDDDLLEVQDPETPQNAPSWLNVPRAPVGSEIIDDPQEAPQKSGLFARMPSLIKRNDPLPEPELVEPQAVADIQEMPGEDRIRAKITNVIKSRVRKSPEIKVASVAPLTKGRGRGPDPLIFTEAQQDLGTDHAQASAARVTPPLMSGVLGAEHQVQDVDQSSRLGHEDTQIHHELSHDPSAEAQDAVLEDVQNIFVDGYDEHQRMEPQHSQSYMAHGQTAQAPKIPTYEPKKVVQQPVRKPIQPSVRAKAEAQPSLFQEAQSEFELPPLNLLSPVEDQEGLRLSDEALEENARLLESVLDDYGVKGEIVSVRPGPVVTMYELEPAPGLKASRVIGLADDIARSMSALSARVSTVPGRSVIGIELPNENREKVVLREILSSRSFGDGTQKLPLALGKDIGGEPIVGNLAKMPHLLIAGTTGSGKSVAINTMILSLLYKLTPEECRMIMIDPKMLELSVYDGIPHLLSPVVTDPKKAVVALKWVVGEMEERYRKMSKMGVRNIDGYNSRVADTLAKGETFSRTVQTGFDDQTGDPIFETEEITPEKMPYIVVIVDEMADLMMVAGKEIEACIQRLAQMARASGIHLIMATQRPSVDVITGTVKANFPTRISFQVTSKIDSRTILGEMGAEQLLGMGDMLYMAGGSKIIRCHGPFVSDEEVEEIVNHLKAYGPPEYMSGVVEGPDEDKAGNIDQVLGLGGNTDGEDALYDQAVAVVIKDRKVSTSYIQRKLSVGYNKVAKLVEQMEEEGLISAANHVGKREILVPEQ